MNDTSKLENQNTSQKYCTSDSPTFLTDEVLYMTSLVELFIKPRAQEPTTRQTPSGFLPPLICKNTRYYINKQFLTML